MLLNAHVDAITTDASGRARGVRLRPRGAAGGAGEAISARKAVVTNASAWDSVKLVDSPAAAAAAAKMAEAAAALPPCPSFMHLHVGFDATGAPRWARRLAPLACHQAAGQAPRPTVGCRAPPTMMRPSPTCQAWRGWICTT